MVFLIKIKLACVFFLFFSCVSFSQIKIQGKVLTSDKAPIQSAIVQLKDDKNNAILAYGTTDQSGIFNLELNVESSSCILLCNALGYEINKQIINKDDYSRIITIILQEKTKKLEEVKIIGSSSGVKIKGDTLSYQLKNFKSGNEKNLKQIIEKLPGFEINERGKIAFAGKTIDKLLVDGKDFFGENHQLATENLTAEMVNKIDVINNYSNNEKIKDFNSKQKTAINIGIDNKYKGKIKGDLSLVSAYYGRYKINSNIFLFTKKSNFSIMTNSNDINDEVLSPQQYFDMKKSVDSEFVSEKSKTNYGNFSIPKELISNDNVSAKKVNFGALSWSFVVNNRIKMNTFSIFNQTHSIQKIIENNQFIYPYSAFSFNTINSQIDNIFINQTKFSSGYKINENSYINYSLIYDPNSFNGYKNINQTKQLESIDNKENRIGLTNTLNHQLSYINRLTENKLLSLYLFNDLFTSNQEYYLQSQKKLFNWSNNFNQITNFKEKNIGFLGKYAFKKYALIYTTELGYSMHYNSFKSQTESNFSKNENNFNFQTNLASFSINKNNGFLHFLTEGKFNYFYTNQGNKLVFQPNLELKLEFSKTSLLTTYYKKNTNYVSLNNTFQNPIIDNYFTLFKNNQINNNQLFNTTKIGINYFYLHLFSGTVIFTELSLENKNLAITQNSNASSDFITVENKMTDKYNSINFNSSIERRLKFIRSKFKTTFFYNTVNSLNFINSIQNEYITDFYRAKISLYSRFKKEVFNYNLGYELDQTIMNTSNVKTKIVKENYYLNFQGSFNKKIYYKLDNAYVLNWTNLIKYNYFKIDFELQYAIYKNLELSIVGNDIINMNANKQITTSLNNTLLQTKILDRLPGFIGIKMKFLF